MDLAVEARDAAGTLLGFAVINGSGTENPYVSNVAVDPAAQGAGVAAKLLQHAGRVRFRNLLPRFRKDRSSKELSFFEQKYRSCSNYSDNFIFE